MGEKTLAHSSPPLLTGTAADLGFRPVGRYALRKLFSELFFYFSATGKWRITPLSTVLCPQLHYQSCS